MASNFRSLSNRSDRFEKYYYFQRNFHENVSQRHRNFECYGAILTITFQKILHQAHPAHPAFCFICFKRKQSKSKQCYQKCIAIIKLLHLRSRHLAGNNEIPFVRIGLYFAYHSNKGRRRRLMRSYQLWSSIGSMLFGFSMCQG